MKVTCDRCCKEFDNLLKEEEKTIEGQKVIYTYLQCPYCKKVFTVCYNTESTLVLSKQIRKHISLLQTIKDEKQYERKLKEVKKKQKRLEREMKINQTKYSMYF